MIFLKKVYAWISHYWWIPLGAIVFIFIFFLRGGSDAIKKILDATKDSYDKQKAALEKIEEEKRLKQEQLQKIYNEAMAEIERTRANATIESKEQTKKEMEKLVEDYKDKPNELAEKFAKEFNIKLSGSL